MTEQKKCENCDSWHKQTESGVGAIPCGGEFTKTEQKIGSCDDWEPKK